MTEGRIRLVSETMLAHDVRCLLMGGQACVLYGAAEFSKDIDFVILAGDQNIERVRAAMCALAAEIIAVPPFDLLSHRAIGLLFHGLQNANFPHYQDEIGSHFLRSKASPNFLTLGRFFPL